MSDLVKKFKNAKIEKSSKLYAEGAKNKNNKTTTLKNKLVNIQSKNMSSFLNDLQSKTGITSSYHPKGGTSLNENISETIHYPPATKEWVNSTYSYNKNYTKTLPLTDNVVNKLIKGYLNMNPLLNNEKSKHADIRFKRLSLNRILVSKAEVKHTNNKVVITVYLYNRNKKFFLYKLKSLYMAGSLSLNKKNKYFNNKKRSFNKKNKYFYNKKRSFNKKKKSFNKKNKSFNKKNKYFNNNKTPFNNKRKYINKRNEFFNKNIHYKRKLKNNYITKRLDLISINKPSFLQKLKNLYMVNNLSLNKNNKSFLYKLKHIYKVKPLSLKKKNKKTLSEENPNLKVNYLKRKIKSISIKAFRLLIKIRKHQNFLSKTLSWQKKSLISYKNKYYKNFIKDAYEIELLYMYYIKMLSLNNNKFKNWFLLGLKKVISKLYNKKVEFNFVNLKYLHLNSDIFTSSISRRMKNRDNALLRVLTKALRLAKVPIINPNFKYHNTKNNFASYYNKYISLTQNMFSKSSTKDYTKDGLHMLLFNLFGGKAIKENNNTLTLKAKNLNNKQINILHDIKHKTVVGVRLEAAGRLTKRLTASRSLFKLRYKGGLKNLDIYKQIIPSVALKGYAKPNVQYTLINYKTRNGSFGLKGWINAS